MPYPMEKKNDENIPTLTTYLHRKSGGRYFVVASGDAVDDFAEGETARLVAGRTGVVMLVKEHASVGDDPLLHMARVASPITMGDRVVIYVQIATGRVFARSWRDCAAEVEVDGQWAPRFAPTEPLGSTP